MREFWQGFEKRNPILAPALEATYHFSKKQLLMNAVLAVLAIPVSLYYDLIPWLQLKATIKVVAIVYLGLLAVTALYNFVRSPLRLLSQNSRDIAQVTEKIGEMNARLIEVSAKRLLPPAAAQETPRPPAPEPNIVYESPDTIDVHRQHRNLLQQGTWRDHRGMSTHFPAVIATFRNKPLKDREIGGRGYISANLAFFGYERGGIVTAHRVAWIGTSDFKVTFTINDPHSLVVAIFENHQLCAIQENTTDDYDNPTKTIPLHGDLHLVGVNLVSEAEGGKIMSSTDLMLEVVRVPKLDFRLERVPSWKRRKLTEIAQAGRDLMERQSASETEMETEYQEWEAQAARFIATHLDHAFTARFRPPPHVSPPGTRPAFRQLSKALEPVGVYNKTRAKVEALERFRDEVR